MNIYVAGLNIDINKQFEEVISSHWLGLNRGYNFLYRCEPNKEDPKGLFYLAPSLGARISNSPGIWRWLLIRRSAV